MKFAILTALVAALAVAPRLSGQEAGQQNGFLRVFLDCQFGCDFDHFRREVDYVSWMRDREDADLQLLVTIEFTGSGGRSYSIDYIGLKEFAGLDDRLVFNSSSTDTRDERRDGLTQMIGLGLIRYVARTPLAPQLRVAVESGSGAPSQVAPEDDPWNFWVFRIQANGRFDGEDRATNSSISGELSANRTTEEFKFDLETRGFYQRREFEIDDSTTSITELEAYGLEALAVWSLNSRWSAGGQVEIDRSTFRNLDWALAAGPAVEFNVFPYEESTRRQFTFFYQAGLRYFDYAEETLFMKTAETRPFHQFRATLSAQEPWGAARGSIVWDQFLHDLSKHRLEVSGRLNVRIFRGLDFSVSGSVARVQDQITLPREDATEEEVFLRLRELGTDFEYRMSFGLSYRFGSIFNNVVNTRF